MTQQRMRIWASKLLDSDTRGESVVDCIISSTNRVAGGKIELPPNSRMGEGLFIVNIELLANLLLMTGEEKTAAIEEGNRIRRFLKW